MILCMLHEHYKASSLLGYILLSATEYSMEAHHCVHRSVQKVSCITDGGTWVHCCTCSSLDLLVVKRTSQLSNRYQIGSNA